MDAARWLPRTRPPAAGFVRFGRVGERIPREGIFVLAYRALYEGTLEPWQKEMLRECLDWFERNMPVCRPQDRAAILFLRDGEHEMARHLWELAHVLRELDVLVDMVWVRRLGRVVKEDSIQVAAIVSERSSRRDRA